VFSEKVHVFEAVKYGKVKKYWNTFLKEHYVDNPGRFEELKKVFAQAPPILRISFQG
jgi:hypothetical protein